MNQTIYYWGTPDTTVSFCEKKYVNTFWIAEYYNTVSALSYIIFGSLFLFTKIKNIGFTMIFLGCSTMIMHGTLKYYGQWLDECSMLILSYSAIQLIHKYYPNKIYYFIIIYYYFIKEYFILFFLTFASMQIYITYSTYKKNLSDVQIIFIKLYVISFILGIICWFIDQYLCKYINDIPFHAAWHIFSAFGMFYGFVSFLIN
jgi:dihydroceramidase|tara:strand:- start:60 stop:665 length:606 start_codon:yes stop_codon:yes gene_type:complete